MVQLLNYCSGFLSENFASAKAQNARWNFSMFQLNNISLDIRWKNLPVRRQNKLIEYFLDFKETISARIIHVKCKPEGTIQLLITFWYFNSIFSARCSIENISCPMVQYTRIFSTFQLNNFSWKAIPKAQYARWKIFDVSTQ